MNQFTPLEEMSLEGFQIVTANMFAHLPRKVDPTCTIWPTKLSFSKMVLTGLNNCEYVRIEVNPTSKCLVVIPVNSTDKNGIRWIKGQKAFSIRNMESKRFGSEIYQTWNLDPEYNYRAVGHLVSCNKKVMMLFDFKKAEVWKNHKADN